MNQKPRLAIEAIDSMKENGSLDEEYYCKCMVELAFNFIKAGDVEGCVKCLSRCTPSYFLEKQREHMMDDEIYNKAVMYLVYKMVQLGMVENGDLYQPTQSKVGSA